MQLGAALVTMCHRLPPGSVTKGPLVAVAIVLGGSVLTGGCVSVLSAPYAIEYAVNGGNNAHEREIACARIRSNLASARDPLERAQWRQIVRDQNCAPVSEDVRNLEEG